jgi:HemY protein
VLLAALAVEDERAGDAAAQAHALEALVLDPGLTAAALIAVRHLTAQERNWKAQDIIEAAWAQAPHRDLAEAYAAMRPEDDLEARANRLIGLAKRNPKHREARVLLAEQLVALNRWDEAREVLAPLAEDFSSARVCNLMAAIALGGQDVLTAQLWRSRAARAGRVADWRCLNCGGVAPEWGAVCPHCGAFDSLNWSAPEASTVTHAPRETLKPAQTPVPISSASQPSGALVTAAPALATKDSPPRFQRPPDDPGPGGQSDIFEVEMRGEAETGSPQRNA